MDNDVLNMQVRKFLKKVGITSQREIENAVREALASGSLTGSERLATCMALRIPEIGVDLTIDGEIALD